MEKMDEVRIQRWGQDARFSRAIGDTQVGGLTLDAVWDVHADPNYDVRKEPTLDKQLIAVRTLSGAGRLYLDDGRRLDVAVNTLLIVEACRLPRYRCLGDAWNFWWFEYTADNPLHVPMYQLLDVPLRTEDAANLQRVFVALRRATYKQRCMASALFLSMLCHWVADWERHTDDSIHEKTIEDVISLMYENLATGWKVSDMAREAHMSVRNFRLVFRKATGQSPKEFYDGLRLAAAQELLRLGTYSVTQVAEQLGFSSPFHFSRAFRQRMGMPPSAVK